MCVPSLRATLVSRLSTTYTVVHVISILYLKKNLLVVSIYSFRVRSLVSCFIYFSSGIYYSNAIFVLPTVAKNRASRCFSDNTPPSPFLWPSPPFIFIFCAATAADPSISATKLFFFFGFSPLSSSASHCHTSTRSIVIVSFSMFESSHPHPSYVTPVFLVVSVSMCSSMCIAKCLIGYSFPPNANPFGKRSEATMSRQHQQ